MAGGDNLGLLIQLEATTAQMRQELTRGENAVAQTAAKVDKSLEKVDSAFDRMAEAASRSGNILADGFKAAGTAVAGFQVLDAVKNATQLASRYNQLGVVLTTIGQNAGYSRKQLQGYETGLQRVGISAMESRNNLARMISANLDLAQSAKLARVAQDAAVIGNISSSEAYARLVDGIAAAEVETLRGIGLNVNFENSYQALAKQLGVTSAELTEQQKAQARANVAIQAGSAITGAYEASLTNAGKMLNSTTRYVENLQVALGQSTQPAFTAAVTSYSDGLKVLADNTGTVVQVMETGLYVALARSAAGLVNAGVARAQNTVAEVAGLRATASAADAQLYSAQMSLRKAEADLAGARAAVAAATSEGTMAAALKSRAAASGAVAAATLRVEAASTTASVANGALIASTTLMGRAMGVATTSARTLYTALGGPVGIIATLAAVGIAFIDFGDKAEEQSDRAAKSMESAAVRIRQAVRDLTPQNLSALTLDQLKSQKANLEQQLADIQKTQQKLQTLSDNDVPVMDGPSLQQANEKMEALQGAIANVTKEIDGSRFAADKAGQSYTDNLNKQVSMLGAVTEVEKLRRMEASGQLKLSVEQREATYKNAQAIDDYNAKQKALNESEKAGKKSASELQSERQKQAKALADLQAQSDIAIRKAQGLADSYTRGKDSLYELTLQQKVEEELLKTGAAAREKVTDAIKGQMDAEARRDIGKSTYDLKAETTALELQAVATLQGTTALEAFNVERAKSAILAGKNVDALTEETRQYLEAFEANQKATKALQQAGEVEGIMDRLQPQAKLLKDYTKEVDALTAAMERNPEKADQYRETLRLLGLEYEQNRVKATAWGQFTEGAVDRVDEAFADAWKNIGKGFDGFATSLKDGFKQLLAELAHLAITKPIIMQIGAAMGVGGLSASQNGGMLGLGGSGGMNLTDLYNYGTGAYKFITGTGANLYNAYSSGGMTGVYNYGANALGNAFSGANTAATGATQAGYTGSQFSNWVAAQNTTWGSAASSFGAIAGGVGGAIQGYQTAGVKGAIAGGVGGWGGATLGTMAGTAAAAALSGTAMGAALGSIIPGIGTVIGAALGAAFGSKLFGGAWETKDAGLTLGVEGGDLSAQQYEYQKKKGGLFSKNKKRTRLSAPDEATQAYLDTMYDGSMAAVEGLFEQFGITISEGAVDGLQVATTQISTKGKSDEEVNTLISQWFDTTFDSITNQLNAAMGSQFREGLTFAGLQSLLTNLVGINAGLEQIHVTALKLSPASAYAADALRQFAGGMEQFGANVNSYYQGFFSQTEREDDAIAALRKQFEAMNLVLPETSKEYRALVESMSPDYDAGQKTLSFLLAQAEAAKSVYDVLERRAKEAADAQQALADAQSEAAKAAAEAAAQQLEAARLAKISYADAMQQAYASDAQRAMAAITSAIKGEQDALTESYNAQVNALNARISASGDIVSSLTSMTSGLSGALKQLLGQSDAATTMLYRQGRATLETAAAIAKAGGSLANFEGLDQALDAVTGNSADRYSNWEHFARDQGRAANLIDELNKAAGGQLSVEQRTLEALNKQLDQGKSAYDAQMKAFQGQIDLAQQQLDTLNGINGSVLSVKDALAQFATALGAAYAGQKNQNEAGSTASLDSQISRIYSQLLGRNADAGGLDFWKQKVTSGALSAGDLQKAIAAGARDYISVYGIDAYRQQYGDKAAEAALKIPAFANGGDYAGGLAMVGERGPEIINFQRPGYVYTASETSRMLGGGGSAEVVRELQALRQENRDMRMALSDIAKHTRGTRDELRQQNDTGVKLETA